MTYPDDSKTSPAAKSEFFRTSLDPTKDFVDQPPPLVPFADWDYYYLTCNLDWRQSKNTAALPQAVSVPKGFVTDLASIPRIFWTILPRQAEYSYPAILHDYLYWEQTCTKAQADDVLEAAMEDMSVGAINSSAILFAVRSFGHGAWEGNAERKAAGERRLLKKFPPDMKATWPWWKEQPNVLA